MRRLPLRHLFASAVLFALGAGCDARNPAFQAVVDDDTTTLRELARKEGFSRITDSVGLTPLMLAAGLGRERAVEVLLAAGVPLENANRDGLTALGLAIGKGEIGIARRLLDHHAEVHTRFGAEGAQQGLISLCVHRKQFEACDLLLEHGLQVDDSGAGRLTALHIAALEANLEGLEYLTRKGASCRIADPDGNTPAHLLLRGKSDRKLGGLRLLADGCRDWDPDVRDRGGNTPLHVASERGLLECVRLLAQRGADLDARDETDNETGLFTDESKSVELLLALGTDPTLKNNAGSTPIRFAIHMDNLESFKVLFEFMGTKGIPFAPGRYDPSLAEEAVAYSRIEILRYLLDRGADPDTRNAFGHTLLEKALEDEREEIAALLCERGAHAPAEFDERARRAGCAIP